jgi:hypothetical protein
LQIESLLFNLIKGIFDLRAQARQTKPPPSRLASPRG